MAVKVLEGKGVIAYVHDYIKSLGSINMRKAVRLSDIAKRLDVSTVTVSNALAEQKGVSEELRD